jgi:hypothetical protein
VVCLTFQHGGFHTMVLRQMQCNRCADNSRPNYLRIDVVRAHWMALRGQEQKECVMRTTALVSSLLPCSLSLEFAVLEMGRRDHRDVRLERRGTKWRRMECIVGVLGLSLVASRRSNKTFSGLRFFDFFDFFPLH